MADEQAIHAGSDAIFASFKKLQEKPVIKKEISHREKLARLAGSDDWKAVIEVIDRYILQLEALPLNTENETVEAVGFRYLASRVTIDYLKDIRDLPERTKKALKKDEA